MEVDGRLTAGVHQSGRRDHELTRRRTALRRRPTEAARRCARRGALLLRRALHPEAGRPPPARARPNVLTRGRHVGIGTERGEDRRRAAAVGAGGVDGIGDGAYVGTGLGAGDGLWFSSHSWYRFLSTLVCVLFVELS